MRKQQDSILVLIKITAFVVMWLLFPGVVGAGDLTPPSGAVDGSGNPVSTMHTLEDIYNQLQSINDGQNMLKKFVFSGYKRVFVTSQNYNGNLGGVDGADDKCQFLADAAELDGKWKAWISVSGISSPVTSFSKDSGYMLVNGLIIATSWTDLTDGTINYRINVDETGSNSPNFYVWTNTNTSGDTAISIPAGSCDGFTAVMNDEGIFHYTYAGWNTKTAASWTQTLTLHCGNECKLYCFEQ